MQYQVRRRSDGMYSLAWPGYTTIYHMHAGIMYQYQVPGYSSVLLRSILYARGHHGRSSSHTSWVSRRVDVDCCCRCGVRACGTRSSRACHTSSPYSWETRWMDVLLLHSVRTAHQHVLLLHSVRTAHQQQYSEKTWKIYT